MGIDEAGRGPVLGPLVVAGACFKSNKALRELKVKDSKLLTPKQRENLFEKIIKFAKYKVVIISAQEIDLRFENNKNLNDLEVDAMKVIISELKHKKVIIDSPYRDCDKLKKELGLSKNDIVEHKADLNYPVVSAASIIAKVIRDNEMRKLELKYKIKMGSGYPSDPNTINFLKKAGKFPFIRTTWETYKNVLKEREQGHLGKWL